MGALSLKSKSNLRRGSSITVIALLMSGTLQIAFLALHAIFQFAPIVLFLETGLAVLITLICLALIIWDDRKASEAGDIADRQLSYLANFATDLYWETDLEGMVLTGGGRLMKTIFPGEDAVVGQHYLNVINLYEHEREKMLTALSEIRPYSDILSVLRDPNGKAYHISLSATPRLNQNGDVIGYLGVGTNVTRRIEDQTRLRYLAEHDMLTGLSNRYAFQTRIDENIRKLDEDENVGLLVIDLDNFKSINDSHGHQIGDALLNQVAKRIRKTIRGNDWAARLGGDEFVIVCQAIPNPMDACMLAARLVTALSRPFQIGELELECSASVGVACTPAQAMDSSALIKCADLAMYEAKGSGRGCYRLYEAPKSLDSFHAN